MRGFLLSLVNLACSLLLLLPQGWCCFITAGRCCGQKPLLASHLPPSTTPSACTQCVGRCVCPKKGKQPLAPAHGPEQRKPPCQSLCCEPLTAVAPKIDPPGLDLAAAGFEVTFTPLPLASPKSVRVNVPPRSAFPPLNVLHCVWLC